MAGNLRRKFPKEARTIKLEGKTFRGNLMQKNHTVEFHDPDRTFTQNLEHCLVDLCHAMEVPIPLWLEKNTREFARFHQTLFFDGQFTETIQFDRFQIRWIE